MSNKLDEVSRASDGSLDVTRRNALFGIAMAPLLGLVGSKTASPMVGRYVVYREWRDHCNKRGD